MSAQALDIHHENNAPVRRGDVSAMNYNPIASTLERVVMDPSLPVERVEHILALFYQAEDRVRQQAREDKAEEARTAYFAAMSACQKKLPVVIKNQRNSHTNSNYADLAAIEDQAMPIIHEHGFAVSFQPDGYNDKGELRILWEISHADGHSRNGVGEIPVDGAGSQGKVNKTGTQAFGSTATYGRRYLLCMLFNISTGDDRDGNAPRNKQQDVISKEQFQTINRLLSEAKTSADSFCQAYKIDCVADLPASFFDEAERLLKKAVAKAAMDKVSK